MQPAVGVVASRSCAVATLVQDERVGEPPNAEDAENARAHTRDQPCNVRGAMVRRPSRRLMLVGSQARNGELPIVEASGCHPTQWESGAEFTFPSRPVEFQSCSVDMTMSDAHRDRVSPRGSDHSHERPENVVSTESDTDSVELEVDGSMASGDEEEVVPSLEVAMPNVERGAVQLAFQRLDQVNLREEFRTKASVMKTVPGFLQGPFRQAMHLVLEEICVGLDRSDNVRQERGWEVADVVAENVAPQTSTWRAHCEGQVVSTVQGFCSRKMVTFD